MDQLTTEICKWMNSIDNNFLIPGSDLPAFGKPIIGCAMADDVLFSFLKQDIGPEFYWTPEQIFKTAFPETQVFNIELSVIAWILPQTGHTRKAHRSETRLPSRDWSLVRHYGEKINDNLRRFVVTYFSKQGIKACAPALLPEWSREISNKYGFASRWSERHTAYVCGLGAFGLSDGLITPVGKAVRVGSVVVEKRFPPTSRQYTTHNEWCLFYAKKKCRACIQRCPAGAISEAGHDKIKCKDYIRKITGSYVERAQLGFHVNSCGLCQTKVPCESRNPTKCIERQASS